MGENKKIKVAMICHFSDAELRENLLLSNMRVTNIVMALFRQGQFIYGDYASWVRAIARECRRFPEIEMHIVTPHFGLKVSKIEFNKDSVHYHVIKNQPSFLLQGLFRRVCCRFLSFNTNYKMIKQIVDEINPDIVVLVGAENPDYSGAVLRIENIPIYVLCQTVLNNNDFRQFYDDESYAYRLGIENQIFLKTNYVAANSVKFCNLLKTNYHFKDVFVFDWPTSRMPHRETCEKKYDFVNFANAMSSQKGYHDSIKALAIVKREYPTVTLALVNNGPIKVQKELEGLIEEFGLQRNVHFIPFFPEKKDLFKFLNSVRFGVLPCKLDSISGTMLQCMSRGIPIVVYKTTGTPDFNRKANCVLIAEMNDVDGLAKHMISLMRDPALGEELINNSLQFMTDSVKTRQTSMDNLLGNFKAIIANYNEGVEIPRSMYYV